MADNRGLTLGPYLALVRDLAQVLAPIEPRSDFKEALGASLTSAARQCSALDALNIAAPIPSPTVGRAMRLDWRGLSSAVPERRWVVGAAAVGSAVSVAGVLAYFWHQRSLKMLRDQRAA